MKKLLSLSVLALAAAAAPAQAAPTTSLDVTVNASVDKVCEVVAKDSTTTLTLSNEQRNTSGVFAYWCNYKGSPAVTISSANGSLYPDLPTKDNGAVAVDYKIAFGDGLSANSASSTSDSASLLQGSGLPYTTTTLAPNEVRKPTLALFLPNKIEIAGSYSDTLTISIAP